MRFPENRPWVLHLPDNLTTLPRAGRKARRQAGGRGAARVLIWDEVWTRMLKGHRGPGWERNLRGCSRDHSLYGPQLRGSPGSHPCTGPTSTLDMAPAHTFPQCVNQAQCLLGHPPHTHSASTAPGVSLHLPFPSVPSELLQHIFGPHFFTPHPPALPKAISKHQRHSCLGL